MDPTCVLGALPCSLSLSGNMMLMAAYGALIAYGAKMIGDGGDELMDSGMFSPAVVGCLVLPFLGALPDAAVILASGLGSNRADVQSDVQVGLGTLAGSTIMLLTVAWASSMWVGRCRIEELPAARAVGASVADDEESAPLRSSARGSRMLCGCIRCGSEVEFFVSNGLTTIDGPFARVDGVSWWRDTFLMTGVQVDSFVPKTAVLMICSCATFLLIQIPSSLLTGRASTKQQRKGEHYWALSGAVVGFAGLALYSLSGLLSELAEDAGKAKEKQVKEKMSVVRVVRQLMRRNIATSSKHAEHWRKINDATVAQLHGADYGYGATVESSAMLATEEEVGGGGGDAGCFSAHPLLNSLAMMIVGTLICAIFSDPLVGAISNCGKISGVPAFFISAIVTPFASNASELYASLKFAAAKQRAKNSATFGQLYSAAIMNNTLALGVFCMLVYAQGLVWLFCTEVVATCLVIVIVGAVGFRSTIRTAWAPFVLALYPASLVFIHFAKPYLDPTM